MLPFRSSFSRVCAASLLSLLCTVSANAQENTENTPEKTELRLRLTPGEVFDQVVGMNQKVSQTVQKVRMDTTTKMRFGLRNEVLSVGENNTFTFKSTYQTVSSETHFADSGGTNLTIRYDSTKPTKDKNPIAQTVAALVGQSFTTTLSSRGEVLKIEGLEAIVQRIVASQNLPAAERAKLSKSLLQSMENERKQMAGFPVYPLEPVAVGDSWSSQSTQNSLAPLLMSAQYTLTSLQNNNATLAVRSQFKANPQAEPANVNTSYTLSGTQNGLMRLDQQTGLPNSFEVHQRLSGRVSVTTKPSSKNARAGKKSPSTQMSWPIYSSTTIRGWTTMAAPKMPKTTGKASVKLSGKEGAQELVLTINTPTHELLFSEKPSWTIRQMSFNGKLLLSQTGAFGSVANSKGSGWEGTGHGFETVEKIELEVDGKTHTPVDGLEVSGDKFVLKKQSRFGPYRHHSVITLDGKKLHEKFDYEVVADDSNVNFMYAFMHCMTNKTDKWMAQAVDGNLLRGEFLDDNSFTLKSDVRWVAVYDSTDEMGLVYMYPEAYKGTSDFANSFWNRPRDNKLYFRPELPRGVGKKFGYEITLQAFNAAPDKWEESANAIIAELK